MSKEIEMELARVLIQEESTQQYVLLREKNGAREFNIVVGTAEAITIDRRLKGKITPRPMTHDLLNNTIEALGGYLERVVINDLRPIEVSGVSSFTFFSLLVIKPVDHWVQIDARPSDAIVLSIVKETPIYVSQHVLVQAIQ